MIYLPVLLGLPVPRVDPFWAIAVYSINNDSAWAGVQFSAVIKERMPIQTSYRKGKLLLSIFKY